MKIVILSITPIRGEGLPSAADSKVAHITFQMDEAACKALEQIEGEVLYVHQVSNLTDGFLSSLASFEGEIHILDLKCVKSSQLSQIARYWKAKRISFPNVKSIVGCDSYGYGTIYQYEKEDPDSTTKPGVLPPLNAKRVIAMPQLDKIDPRSVLCLKLHVYNKTLQLRTKAVQGMSMDTVRHLKAFNNVQIEWI